MVIGLDHCLEGVLVGAAATIGIGVKAFHQCLVLGFHLISRGGIVQTQRLQGFELVEGAVEIGVVAADVAVGLARRRTRRY